MLDITKKFYCNKLKFARLYRGLSMEELGEKIGKSKQVISQYESEDDDLTPSFDIVANISEKLKFPISFFYTEDKSNVDDINTYFRALLSSNKKDKIAQSKKATIVIEIYKFLEKYIEFPKLNIPNINKKDLEDGNYYKIAKEIRKFWNLGDKPINNIINVLESNGFIVSSINTNTNDIDAFTHYIKLDGEKYFCIILGNEKKSFARRQFNTAHELAHVILHGTNIDINTLTREEFREVEKEADKFAAEFLLPADSFKKDLIYPTNLKFYEELKKKWKVSIVAMLIRAADLGVITRNQLQYLIKQAYAKGYRTEEPLDDTLKIHEPTLIRLALNMLLDNNQFKANDLMKEINKYGIDFESEEIEDLIGIERGTLKNREVEVNKVIKIDFKK